MKPGRISGKPRPGGRARIYYVAPCLLGRHHENYFDLRGLDLVVADPGGGSFALETTPMNGRIKVAACAECSRAVECAGLREDYFDIYGAAHVRPLPGR